MDMREYVERQGVTLRVTSGPVVVLDREDPDGWGHRAYRVTLRRPGARPWARIKFRMGTGLPNPPEAAEVFDSLVRDAWGYHASQGFTDWALELGMDPDSRRDERIYRACGRTRDRMVEFLGSVEEFERAANDVDPL